MIFFRQLLCFLFIGTSLCQAQTWTPADMMKLKTMHNVQVSPDNQTVLFAATEALLADDQNNYLSRIYAVPIDNPTSIQALTPPICSCTQPRWSPDGKWIAFLCDEKGHYHLYLMPSSGSLEAPLVLTHFNNDVQTFRWSPDSRSIAFVSRDLLSIPRSQAISYAYEEEEGVNRLWLLDISKPDQEPRVLTPIHYPVRGNGDFGTTNEEFDWSPDGRLLTFAYSPSEGFDAFYMESSLATCDVKTGVIHLLPKTVQHESLPCYSPDGKWLAYLAGTSPNSYAFNRTVMVYSLESNQSYPLAQTFNGGPYLAGPSLLGWSADSQSVYFFEPKGTSFQLVKLSKDGQHAQEIATDNLLMKEPALSPDRQVIGFVGQTVDQPPEIYLAHLSTFKPVCLSRLNESFLQLPLIKTQLFSWQATDGQQITGLLTYPVNYQEGKRYPLLLVIHGGPMAFFDETYIGTPYSYPLAAFAQAGFMILRPNPRGSCGYGQTFRCLNYRDWGGKDFEDLMTGVDKAIETGLADPKRLGIMGWSYGGYMTAWAITQTQRFKAASMGAGLSNLVSMAGTTDLHRFLPDYLGPLEEQTSFYQQRSPLYHVKNVQTPCLIQHGTDDKRVPVSQAYEYYHALKRLQKPVSLILYPGMGHRFYKPAQQLDAMESNLKWFKNL